MVPTVNRPLFLVAPLVVAILAALGAPGVHANPDVWVRAGVTYHFEDRKVSAITFEWRFDAYFSSRAIQTYDRDKNGVLEVAEIDRLRGEAFEPLGKFDYYVHIWDGQIKRDDPQIEAFDAAIDDRKLVYRFTVRFTPPANPAVEKIIASLYDRNIVVDFRLFEQNFLLVDGAMDPDCKFRIARGKGAQSGHAQAITLNCGD